MVAGVRRAEPVPAEFRFLGLDRRTFAGAIFVIVVFVLFSVVMPKVNAAIPWNDPVVAGEDLALTKDIAFMPAVGWNVEDGHRLDADGTVTQSGDATLTGAGVELSMSTGAFDGTPADLLAQFDTSMTATSDGTFRANGTATTTRTDSGEVGVIQQFGSLTDDGLIAAFVIDGTGVKVTVQGSPAQMKAAATQIEQMIASLRALDTKEAS